MDDKPEPRKQPAEESLDTPQPPATPTSSPVSATPLDLSTSAPISITEVASQIEKSITAPSTPHSISDLTPIPISASASGTQPTPQPTIQPGLANPSEPTMSSSIPVSALPSQLNPPTSTSKLYQLTSSLPETSEPTSIQANIQNQEESDRSYVNFTTCKSCRSIQTICDSHRDLLIKFFELNNDIPTDLKTQNIDLEIQALTALGKKLLETSGPQPNEICWERYNSIRKELDELYKRQRELKPIQTTVRDDDIYLTDFDAPSNPLSFCKMFSAHPCPAMQETVKKLLKSKDNIEKLQKEEAKAIKNIKKQMAALENLKTEITTNSSEGLRALCNRFNATIESRKNLQLLINSESKKAVCNYDIKNDKVKQKFCEIKCKTKKHQPCTSKVDDKMENFNDIVKKHEDEVKKLEGDISHHESKLKKLKDLIFEHEETELKKHKEINRLENEISNCEEEVNNLKDKVRSHKYDIKMFKNQINKWQDVEKNPTDIQKIFLHEVQKLEDKLNITIIKANALQRERKMWEDRQIDPEDEERSQVTKNLDKDFKKRKNEIKKIQDEIKIWNENMKEPENKVWDFENEVMQLENVLKQREDEIKFLGTELDIHEDVLKKLQNELKEKKNQIKYPKQVINKVHEDMKTLILEIDNYEANIKKFQDVIKIHEDEIKKLEGKVSKTEEVQIKNLRKREDEIKKREKRVARRELELKNYKVKDIENLKKKLKESEDIINKAINQGSKYKMKEQKSTKNIGKIKENLNFIIKKMNKLDKIKSGEVSEFSNNFKEACEILNAVVAEIEQNNCVEKCFVDTKLSAVSSSIARLKNTISTMKGTESKHKKGLCSEKGLLCNLSFEPKSSAILSGHLNNQNKQKNNVKIKPHKCKYGSQSCFAKRTAEDATKIPAGKRAKQTKKQRKTVKGERPIYILPSRSSTAGCCTRSGSCTMDKDTCSNAPCCKRSSSLDASPDDPNKTKNISKRTEELNKRELKLKKREEKADKYELELKKCLIDEGQKLKYELKQLKNLSKCSKKDCNTTKLENIGAIKERLDLIINKIKVLKQTSSVPLHPAFDKFMKTCKEMRDKIAQSEQCSRTDICMKKSINYIKLADISDPLHDLGLYSDSENEELIRELQFVPQSSSLSKAVMKIREKRDQKVQTNLRRRASACSKKKAGKKYTKGCCEKVKPCKIFLKGKKRTLISKKPTYSCAGCVGKSCLKYKPIAVNQSFDLVSGLDESPHDEKDKSVVTVAHTKNSDEKNTNDIDK